MWPKRKRRQGTLPARLRQRGALKRQFFALGPWPEWQRRKRRRGTLLARFRQRGALKTPAGALRPWPQWQRRKRRRGTFPVRLRQRGALNTQFFALRPWPELQHHWRVLRSRRSACSGCLEVAWHLPVDALCAHVATIGPDPRPDAGSGDADVGHRPTPDAVHARPTGGAAPPLCLPRPRRCLPTRRGPGGRLPRPAGH